MKYHSMLNNSEAIERAQKIVGYVDPDSKPLHELLIRPVKSKRSLAQNSALHGVISDIANYYGYQIDEMKVIIKDQLHYYHDIETKKGVYRVYDETSRMSVEELSNMIEKVVQWAAENGIEVSI